MKANLQNKKLSHFPHENKTVNGISCSIPKPSIDLSPEITSPLVLDTTSEVNWYKVKNNSFKQIASFLEPMFERYPKQIDEVRKAFLLVLISAQNYMNQPNKEGIPSAIQYFNQDNISSSVKSIYDVIVNKANLFNHFQIICAHKKHNLNHIKHYLCGLGLTKTARKLKDFINNVLPKNHLKIALEAFLSKHSLEKFFLAEGAIGRAYLIPLDSFSFNKVVLKKIKCPIEKRSVINISAENDALRFNELMGALGCPHYAKAFSYHYSDDDLLVTPYIEGKIASPLQRIYCINNMKKAGFLMHDDYVADNFITDYFGNTVVIDVDHVANTKLSPPSPRTNWVIKHYKKS